MPSDFVEARDPALEVPGAFVRHRDLEYNSQETTTMVDLACLPCREI
ncbi:MAG: hypothetical protein M8467_11935 [Anaerolineae bacterium]|nr:hypothetical protein [Anaerolineae bacterium]